MLETGCFYAVRSRDNWGYQVSCPWESVKRGLSAREAEESPLLEAVARERLLKTEQAGKCLAGAVVIYGH
jgi:hypothetical protein